MVPDHKLKISKDEYLAFILAFMAHNLPRKQVIKNNFLLK